MWPNVEKNRRLLEEEEGFVVKEWGGKTSVALIYPNTYDVGMSNLAIHSLYKLFNENPGIVCERAFLPAANDIEEHRRTKTPLLSLETQRPLSEFDCIAFSISFQNDYLNILPILKLSRVPHRIDDRGKDDPLLIAGGCAVTMNHLPLAGIFDAFFIGEAEEALPEIIAAIREGARPEGTFGGRRFVKKLDDWPTETVVHSRKTEFGDMHLVEMSRGCPRKCKFCATPCIYAPLRFRSFDAIMSMVKNGLSYRKRFGLIGSDLLSHPDFFQVVEEIHKLGAAFSPSSLRVDAIDERVAQLLEKSGHRSISLGVEAGSDPLRASIGKRFPRERILEAAEALARHGITSLRLYFMMGLPGETPDDVALIARIANDVLLAIRTAAPKGVRSTKVSLTVTPFVPKPLTPFENTRFAGEKYLKEAIGTIKKLTARSEGIALHHDPIVSSECDYLLSNEKREMTVFLEKCASGKTARSAIAELD